MHNKPTIRPVGLREDLPLYPPTQQLVRVTAATVAGPAGVAQVAGSSVLSSPLHVAFTQQLRTDSLLPRDREPCLAAGVRGYELTPGSRRGRVAGSHGGLPVYEVVGVGLTGSVGPMGPSGSPGAEGPAGSSGPQGSKGDPGTQGSPGATGSTGDPGTIGPTGSRGDPGTQGSPGPQGVPGPQGSKGDPGTIGPTGSRGDPGTQGPPGQQGPPGPAGSVGPAGSCGPCGSESPNLICGLLRELPNFNAGVQQILGHDATGSCRWYDVEMC